MEDKKLKVSEIVNYLVRLYNTEAKMINDFPEDRRITVALVGKPGKVCIPYRRGFKVPT